MRKIRTSKSTSLLASRWMLYAAAAGATAASAASAEADIHYSGIVDARVDNLGGDGAALPLSAGASIELSNFSRGPGSSYNIAAFHVLGADVSHALRNSASVAGVVAAARLRPGQVVSQGSFRASNPSTFRNIRSTYFGNFDDGGRGFIGFKFNTGSGTQYGWARIRITPYPRVKLIVLDYAWGDPGDAIATGQTGSANQASAPVPSAGSLGLLAFGGAGLEAWRSTKQVNGNSR